MTVPLLARLRGAGEALRHVGAGDLTALRRLERSNDALRARVADLGDRSKAIRTATATLRSRWIAFSHETARRSRSVEEAAAFTDTGRAMTRMADELAALFDELRAFGDELAEHNGAVLGALKARGAA